LEEFIPLLLPSCFSEFGAKLEANVSAQFGKNIRRNWEFRKGEDVERWNKQGKQ
jgi:hypothetical protein